MQNINSDQLRKRLAKHTRKMNWLAKQNDLIVELLAQRGLKAIEPDNNDVAIHPCVMQLDKLGEALFRAQFEPKRSEEIALTAEELKAGWWWCADVNEDCRSVLLAKGVSEAVVFRSYLRMEGLKQIHRIGNEFYWGAASDQAN